MNKLEKPTLVLMAGFPGAGKTTLARALGKALRWPVLDKDWLKHSLLKQNLDLEKAGEIAYELLFAMAEDIFIRQQLSIILDTSARYPFILERAAQIAHNADGRLKIVLCRTPCSQRKERLNSRADQYRFYTNAFETTAIENDLEHFKHLPEDTLIVETDNAVETYLPKTIQYLIQ